VGAWDSLLEARIHDVQQEQRLLERSTPSPRPPWAYSLSHSGHLSLSLVIISFKLIPFPHTHQHTPRGYARGRKKTRTHAAQWSMISRVTACEGSRAGQRGEGRGGAHHGGGVSSVAHDRK